MNSIEAVAQFLCPQGIVCPFGCIYNRSTKGVAAKAFPLECIRYIPISHVLRAFLSLSMIQLPYECCKNPTGICKNLLEESTSMDKVIMVRGARKDVLDIKNELEKRFEQNISISAPTPFKGGLRSREAYRQNELFEIVIAIIINLATAAIYDQAKMVVEELRRKRKVEVHYEDNLTQTKARNEISQHSVGDQKDMM